MAQWDWVDTMTGSLAGFFTGILGLFGWFSGRITKVHERIDLMQQISIEHAEDIATLKAHQVEGARRLERIEDSVVKIDAKQDRQMEILSDIRRRGR